MNNFSGLNTADGKPILSYSYIEQLRDIENRSKESKNFIFQKAAQENGLHSSVDIMVFGGNRGGGKANPYSTPVATPMDHWSDGVSRSLSDSSRLPPT